MIKILVADDHQLFIDGVKSTLVDSKDIEIVAEAKDGVDVLKLMDNNDIDVVLMDINMPVMDGLVCTKQVLKKYPDSKILVLSQFDDDRFIRRMVRYGVSGYLVKDTNKEELIMAIRKVFNGEKYFSEKVYERMQNKSIKARKHTSLFPRLTLREKEVLKLICHGYSSHEIAEKLFISSHTVENHRAHLICKSEAKNTAGLVRWAMENDFYE